jgi:hypothetical protein
MACHSWFRLAAAAAEEGVRAVEVAVEGLVGPSQRLQLGLHLDLQGEKLGFVAAFALFGEGLEGLALALVGFLAQSVALFHDADVELEYSWRLS